KENGVSNRVDGLFHCVRERNGIRLLAQDRIVQNGLSCVRMECRKRCRFGCPRFVWCLPITIALISLCSCEKPKLQPKVEAQNAVTVARVDGGPLTSYDAASRTRSSPVAGSPLRRSFVILNDPESPLQITSFGRRTQSADDWTRISPDIRFATIFDWKLMP